MKTLKERFWEKVDKSGPTQAHMLTPCWRWVASKDASGYGKLATAPSKWRRAHVVSWVEIHGRPLQDCVLHHCDFPECTNPDHLYEGTRKDNAQDREQRGRGNHASGARHGCSTNPGLRAGEKNSHAKLTESDVRLIRSRFSKGERQVDLAREFGLTREGVFGIVRGKTWRHVEG